MKYGDEEYKLALRMARLPHTPGYDEAVLAAEAECERLRNCPNEFWECAKEIRRLTKECESLRISLEEYRARYGKITHVDQEETK